MSNEHGGGRRPAARPADARPGAGSPPILEQAFDAGSLYALRAAAGAHAARAGLPQARVHDLVVAVHELAANSVRHGAGQGRLRIWADGSALYCQVTDGQVTADGAARAADGPGSPAGRGGRLADRARAWAVAGPSGS